VSESIRGLLDAWATTPAYVQGRRFDVLAANRPATALTPMFTPGRNILREVFLNPAVRDQFPDWNERLPGLVAALRALAGPDVTDPALVDLVGELSVRSERFRQLWSRHEVRPQLGGGIHRIDHPQVGLLELRHDKFTVAGGDGQMLVVYHAAPGSSSERALALLATLGDGQRPDGPPVQRDTPSASR
ncbi:MAG TPA: transcriptional regulator, partial [Actinomycetota bacterium]|nr:transcriptional regulator [Actinomycetota bacterium]